MSPTSSRPRIFQHYPLAQSATLWTILEPPDRSSSIIPWVKRLVGLMPGEYTSRFSRMRCCVLRCLNEVVKLSICPTSGKIDPEPHGKKWSKGTSSISKDSHHPSLPEYSNNGGDVSSQMTWQHSIKAQAFCMPRRPRFYVPG